MDTYHSNFIKQEAQDDPIIQNIEAKPNIEVKPEPLEDSEVIIQTVDIKMEEVSPASDQDTKQPEIKKRKASKRSKKSIVENHSKDDQSVVRIINIKDMKATAKNPKSSRPKRIPKRFKADNFDIQNIGRYVSSAELGNKSQVDGVGYIKTEKELIIDDYSAEVGSEGQDIDERPRKRKKIEKKSRKSKDNDKRHESSSTSFVDQLEDPQNIQNSSDHLENHQTTSTEADNHSLDPQDYQTVSQTQQYLIDLQNPSTTIKQEADSDDSEASTDLVHKNQQIDSDDSNSNNSNSNYKFENGKFICIHCNMQFKLLKNFDKHECIICQHCKKIFTTRCALKRHVLHIHTETDEIFECKDCNKTFKAEHYLKVHIRSHDKIHECDSCGMKFGNTSRLNEHRIKHKNPEMLTCKVCDRKCASRSSLRFHMKVHEIDRQKHLKCDKCSFTTDDNRTLVKHQKTHAKQEEKFKGSTDWLECEKCQARLKNKQSLYNHMYYVHSEMSFQCNLCGIVVKTERNLKRHWQNIHEHENKS